MDIKEDVVIHKSIITTFNNTRDIYVSVDVLRAFIEKHGVDYRDRYNDCLLSHCSWMPLTHIDLVLSYKPRFVRDDGCVEYFGYYNFKSVYVLKKILERDQEHFFYVTRPLFDNKLSLGTYLVHLKDVSRIEVDDHMVFINLMILLLENHGKRYYKLFDLLLQVVEKDNNNKKPRVY